jgi:uncharacterized membrane protein YeaQ/YmgE (transglycosylase-associated protein family)
MGRKMAYVLVGSLGFVVGIIIYIFGVLVLPWLIETFPAIASILTENRQIIEALISGFIGSILSIIIAYVWATRSSTPY